MHTRTHSHRQTHTHTHTHTHSQKFKFWEFFGKLQNQICEQLRQYWSAKFNAKFKFFNENRSKRDSGQTENQLKYLHYLNKMIEKCKVRKFIFSKALCFWPATLLKNKPFQDYFNHFA